MIQIAEDTAKSAQEFVQRRCGTWRRGGWEGGDGTGGRREGVNIFKGGSDYMKQPDTRVHQERSKNNKNNQTEGKGTGEWREAACVPSALAKPLFYDTLKSD